MIQQFGDLNLSTVRVHKSGLNAKQMNFYLINYVCKFTKIQRFIYLQHVTIVLSEDLRATTYFKSIIYDTDNSVGNVYIVIHKDNVILLPGLYLYINVCNL